MIYLDANAGARPRPAALEAVRELIAQKAPGNPSSVHTLGQQARSAVFEARRSVLELVLGSAGSAERLIFTSGGTESCSTLLYGFLGALSPAETSVVASAIEHPAMLEPLNNLARRGAEVSFIKPDREGFISPEDIARSASSKTSLVSLMGANNETGAIQPVVETARLLRRNGFQGAIICDAVQALGKSAVSFSELFASGVDGVALSAHKIGGLSGCGAVILSSSAESCRLFAPFLLGGGQEGGYRAGTENLAGIVSFGAAARELSLELPQTLERLARLRDKLSRGLLSRLSDSCVRLTPSVEGRALVNTLLVRFSDLRADDIVVALDLEGVAVSTGSACSSGKQKPSHVVQAMGYDEREAREAVRFSLDWCTTEEEIDETLGRTFTVLQRMRGANA